MTPAPTVDIVITIYNREDELQRDVPRIHAFLEDEFPFSARITIADGWLTSDARIVAWLDLNRGADLNALLPLVAPVISGHSDVSIGSRSTRRISRYYDLLLRIGLGVRVRDAQSSLTATRAEIARLLGPTVQNRNRFFQAELLFVAELGRVVHPGAAARFVLCPGSSTAPAVGGRFITS